MSTTHSIELALPDEMESDHSSNNNDSVSRVDMKDQEYPMHLTDKNATALIMDFANHNLNEVSHTDIM